MAECVMVDVYGYVLPCDTPDPCHDGLTLWRALACEGDDLPAFCASFPDHPVCPAPAPATTPLPRTGGGALLLVAALLALAGGALRALTEGGRT